MDIYGRIKALGEELECAVAGEHSAILMKMRDAVESALPAASLEADNVRKDNQISDLLKTVEMMKKEIESLKRGNGQTVTPAGLTEEEND